MEQIGDGIEQLHRFHDGPFVIRVYCQPDEVEKLATGYLIDNKFFGVSEFEYQPSIFPETTLDPYSDVLGILKSNRDPQLMQFCIPSRLPNEDEISANKEQKRRRTAFEKLYTTLHNSGQGTLFIQNREGFASEPHFPVPPKG